MALLEKFLQDAHQNCIPLFSTIEVSQACNFSCQHCYNFDRSGGGQGKGNPRKLNKEKILSLINELAELGAMQITLTGGEILLNSQLVNYISSIRGKNCLARIKTNGALLSDQLLDKLIKAGLNSIEVSLYGINEEHYQLLTRKLGMWKKVKMALEVLANAQARGFISVTINLMLFKFNIDHLQEMIFFVKELGLDYQISSEITERYDHSPGAREMAITKSQWEVIGQSVHAPLFNYFSEEPKNFQCSCARSVIAIGEAGEVFPCIGAPILAGSVWEDSLKTIWDKSRVFKKIRNLGLGDFDQCISCSVKSFCTRSSGSAYVNTGNYTGCDPYAREMAEIRQNVFS